MLYVGYPLPKNTIPDDSCLAAYFVREHIRAINCALKELLPRPPKKVCLKNTKRDAVKIKKELERIAHHSRTALSLLETLEKEIAEEKEKDQGSSKKL